MKDINYAQDIYTHEQVLRMLRSNREIKFEYVVRDNYNHTIGALSNATGSISYDSTQGIMRTCQITAKRSELLDLNSVDNRIVPYFCLLAPNGHWLKWPLGVFIINPSTILRNKSTYVTVVGYDLAELANDIKLEDTVTYRAGTKYTSALIQRISAIYPYYEIVENDNLTRPSDYEYEIGTSELNTINAMLDSVNYYPLYFDEYGKAIAEPYIWPEQRSVQIDYSTDRESIIFDGVSQSTDLFNVPNKFIRYTNDSDAPPLRSVYTVTDESIPSSYPNRGRIITDVKVVKDVSTQATLDSLTRRAAITSSQVTESLEFSSALMPGHGYKNCIHVSCTDAGVDNKYIEYAWEMDLRYGGSMRHKCHKAISLMVNN